MRDHFDTSAFLPWREPAGTWQRYELEFPDEETRERVFARRMEIEEECSRSGRWARARAYDRGIVKRYGV